MGERKISQVIWLSPQTFHNIVELQYKSGAYRIMAINNFIARILDYVTKDDETIKKILTNILDTHPEIHEFSEYVKIVTEGGDDKPKVYQCPLCMFRTERGIRDLGEHLRIYHKAKDKPE